MLEYKVRNRLTYLFLISNFGTFALLILISFAGGFDDSELKTTAGLILPLFAVYSTAIIKSVVLNRHKKINKRRKVSRQFGIIATSLSIFFTLFIPFLVFAAAANWISSFEQFVLYLTVTETIFATYLGMLIDGLYNEEQGKQNK